MTILALASWSSSPESLATAIVATALQVVSMMEMSGSPVFAVPEPGIDAVPGSSTGTRVCHRWGLLFVGSAVRRSETMRAIRTIGLDIATSVFPRGGRRRKGILGRCQDFLLVYAPG